MSRPNPCAVRPGVRWTWYTASLVPDHQRRKPNLGFNPLNWLLGLFSLDIGINLGTPTTLVNVQGKGIVINKPSGVAMEKKSKRILAIGDEAKEMVGRPPANVVDVRPLRDGVISEFDITEAVLEYFIGM